MGGRGFDNVGRLRSGEFVIRSTRREREVAGGGKLRGVFTGALGSRHGIQN